MAHSCIYNVEHGDYIAIATDNDISIIRDCGTICKGRKSWLEMNLPNTLSAYKSTQRHEVMVTHPHKDHYWGFEKMRAQMKEGQPKFFDVAYVPLLYINSEDRDLELLRSKNYQLKDLSLTALAVKLALHLWKHMPTGTRNYNPTNWLKVAPLMANISNQLIGVYAGSTAFNHWKSKGTILWPPHLDNDYYDDNKSKIISLLGFDMFFGDFDIDGIVIKVLELIDGIKNMPNFLEPLGNVSNMDYSRQINEIISQVIRDEPNSNSQHTSSIDDNVQKFGTFIDDHSIVFSIGDKENSALFLSDLNPSAMDLMVEDMINHRNNDQYTFIKSAHHGTRLSDDLFHRLQTNAPLAIVHSCGKGHGSSLQPDNSKMPNHYSSLSSIHQIDCTSWKSTWNQPKPPYNQFTSNCKCYQI